MGFNSGFKGLNPLHVSSTFVLKSGGQLYEYSFWYNHSVLVAVRHTGRDPYASRPVYRPLTSVANEALALNIRI